MEWDRPSRTDNYLMEIACEVRRVLNTHPEKVKLKHFLLTFGKGHARQKKLTEEQAMNFAISKWVASVGGRVQVVENGSGT